MRLADGVLERPAVTKHELGYERWPPSDPPTHVKERLAVRLLQWTETDERRGVP